MEGEQDFKRDVVEASIRKLQEQAAEEAVKKANKFMVGDSGRAIAEHVLNKATSSAEAAEEARVMEANRKAKAAWEARQQKLKDALKGGPAGV